MTFKLRSGNTTPFKKMASKDSKAYGIAKKNHELPEVKITDKKSEGKKPTRYKKSKKITQQVVDDPDSTIDKSKTKKWKKAYDKSRKSVYTGKHKLVPRVTGKIEFK